MRTPRRAYFEWFDATPKARRAGAFFEVCQLRSTHKRFLLRSVRGHSRRNLAHRLTDQLYDQLCTVVAGRGDQLAGQGSRLRREAFQLTNQLRTRRRGLGGLGGLPGTVCAHLALARAVQPFGVYRLIFSATNRARQSDHFAPRIVTVTGLVTVTSLVTVTVHVNQSPCPIRFVLEKNPFQ